MNDKREPRGYDMDEFAPLSQNNGADGDNK